MSTKSPRSIIFVNHHPIKQEAQSSGSYLSLVGEYLEQYVELSQSPHMQKARARVEPI
jgi:hypothetical protein